MPQIIIGITIPFLGTLLGAALVFFMRGAMNKKFEKGVLGFAGGVMVAASIWSLIDPALAMSRDKGMGRLAFLPAAIGFLIGILFIFLLDIIVPHIHAGGNEEGRPAKISKTAKMMFAVTLHNIPEGMAVGVVLAGAYYGETLISFAGALVLAIGIAIQNLPESAIIAMPLYQAGNSKFKSFLLGSLSGIVEPIAALLTILVVGAVKFVLPYVLSFAAGVMFYVVVEELVPESQEGGHTNVATLSFAAGFLLMMILDVALG